MSVPQDREGLKEFPLDTISPKIRLFSTCRSNLYDLSSDRSRQQESYRQPQVSSLGSLLCSVPVAVAECSAG